MSYHFTAKVTALKNTYYEKEKAYWSTHGHGSGKLLPCRPIRVAYVKGWHGLMFPYDPKVVDVIREIPTGDRYFFKRQALGRAFTGWLILSGWEKKVFSEFSDRIEYLVPESSTCEPIIPEVYQHLSFYPVIK